jgi:hypothetical protein
LLIWFAFAPAVLVLGWRSLTAWSIAALAIIPYMKDFPTGRLRATDTAETVATFALPSFSEATSFVFAYLGAPVGYPSFSLSQAFGILGLIALATNFAYLVTRAFSTRKEKRTFLVWMGLAGFALFTAVVMMLGGGQGFGLEAALWSRFHAFSLFWWIANTVLSAVTFVCTRQSSPTRSSLIQSKGHPISLFNTVALFIAGLGLAHANLVAFNHAVSYFTLYKQNEYCVFNYERASDECLSIYYPNGERVRERMAYLAQRYTTPIENTGKVPPPQPGHKGVFRCAAADIDSATAPSEMVPPDVVSNACGRMGLATGQIRPPSGESRNLCVIDGWSTLGTSSDAYGESWCTIDW